ncbi:ROK family protein [Ottowia testudinis]|uniref:ROK family protein n=1 Tax=Ottowia testudinis TaxID=2816950 RepID=A0A975CNZ6_9BURK|nr:ROK family protein [Ottowia testudinis]QTD47023.1 ROK family protein [Ottowia testudinis]
MTALRLGIDLGGTKIEIAALDAQGAFVLRERVPTPRGDYPATLRAIAALVEQAEQRLGVAGLPLGMGIPGSLSPRTGRVRNANSTALNGQPLGDDLQALLQRPVRLENDANCLALSEATDGAGAGAGVVFAAILGTGVGAGVAVHGRVLRGCNGVAGEWGHNPLPRADAHELAPVCWCGRAGCQELFLSGPGLAADHARCGAAALSTADIVAAARAGDGAAAASLTRYAERLARALAQVINVLDPDVIVLGGGMSNVGALYEQVPRLWAPHVFSDVVRTALRPARHGDSSGVRGAAWLAAGGDLLASR